MIKPRARKESHAALEKVNELAKEKLGSRLVLYVPLEHKDSLKLYALKCRTTPSEIMRKVLMDFLEGLPK